MPNEVARYWSEAWPQMQLPHAAGLPFDEALATMQNITKQSAQDLLNSPWYRALRQHGLWLLKW
jgi:hypothetical protein